VCLDLLGFGCEYKLIVLSLENSGITFRFKKFILGFKEFPKVIIFFGFI
jgi:hypothetical protein